MTKSSGTTPSRRPADLPGTGGRTKNYEPYPGQAQTQKGGKKTKKASMSSEKSSKKSKKSKCSKPMKEGYACCMNCRKNVKILNSVIKKTKNGRNQMVGKADCGHTVYRFVKG